MKTLKSHFDFYRLPEQERVAMIGECFREEGPPPRKKSRRERRRPPQPTPDSTLYFPVGLAEGEFNYGMPQGLVFVTPIHNFQGKKWFRVGAASPDDLDIDLDFGEGETSIRQDVIDFIRKACKRDVTYRGFMTMVQKAFNAGTFTS